jgi:hypothetical protein
MAGKVEGHRATVPQAEAEGKAKFDSRRFSKTAASITTLNLNPCPASVICTSLVSSALNPGYVVVACAVVRPAGFGGFLFRPICMLRIACDYNNPLIFPAPFNRIQRQRCKAIGGEKSKFSNALNLRPGRTAKTASRCFGEPLGVLIIR